MHKAYYYLRGQAGKEAMLNAKLKTSWRICWRRFSLKQMLPLKIPKKQ